MFPCFREFGDLEVESMYLLTLSIIKSPPDFKTFILFLYLYVYHQQELYQKVLFHTFESNLVFLIKITFFSSKELILHFNRFVINYFLIL